jgi:hypothetical protein
MHVFSAWTLESFASRVVANNAAWGDARKNHSLASRTSGGLSGDILKTMPFEPNATPVFQIKRKRGKKDGVHSYIIVYRYCLGRLIGPTFMVYAG